MPPAPNNRTRPPWAATVVPFLLFAVLVAVLTSAAVTYFQWPVASDFAKFYASARLLTNGQDIYTSIPLHEFGPLPPNSHTTKQVLNGNMNPPAVTLLFVPFALLPLSSALRAWAILSLGLALLSCALVWIELNPPPRRLAGLLWLFCGFLLYVPTLVALQLGQLTFLTFFLLVAAWLAVRADHEVAVGVLIGLAFGIKLFVGLVVVYFLIRRRWRIVFWCGVVFAATTIAGALAAGWESYPRFLSVLASVTWYSSPLNASLAGLTLRLFGGTGTTESLLHLPLVGRWLNYALTFITCSVLVWLVWPRTKVRRNEVDALGLGLAFCFSLLISPLGWSYYFPILLIAVYPTWKRSFYGSRWARRLIIASVIISAVPQFYTGLTNLYGWDTLAASIYFIALLACAWGLALAYRACLQQSAQECANM